jgi:hypothetical protein
MASLWLRAFPLLSMKKLYHLWRNVTAHQRSVERVEPLPRPHTQQLQRRRALHQAMSHVGFGLVLAVDRQGHFLHGKVSGSPADQIQELEVGDR